MVSVSLLKNAIAIRKNQKATGKTEGEKEMKTIVHALRVLVGQESLKPEDMAYIFVVVMALVVVILAGSAVIDHIITGFPTFSPETWDWHRKVSSDLSGFTSLAVGFIIGWVVKLVLSANARIPAKS